MPKNIHVKEAIVGSPDSLSDLSLSPGDTMEAIFGTEGHNSSEQRSPFLSQELTPDVAEPRLPAMVGAVNYNTTVTPKPDRSLKPTATTHFSAPAPSTHDSMSMKHEEDADDDAAPKIVFDLAAKLQRMRDNNAFILDKTKLLNEKRRLIKEAEEENERLQLELLELLELCQLEHEGNKEKEVKLEQENEELSKKIDKIYSDTKDMSVNVKAAMDSRTHFRRL